MRFLKSILTSIALMCAVTVNANDNTIKIVSSFPAGSGPDTLSRTIAVQLSKKLNVPVIVENKPGGNGVVAMTYAVNLRDSNNVILYASHDNLVNYPILSNNYSVIDQFRPMKEAFLTELVLATGPKNDNITNAKNASYGSWGVGSASHILGTVLGQRLEIKNSVHIPYKDYGQWFTDISNGTLAFSFVTIASTSQLEKSNKIKYLAIASSARNPKYPTLPTLQELTGHRITGEGWAGLYVVDSVSDSRERELKQALDQVYTSQEVVDSINNLSYTYRNASTSDFKKSIQKEKTYFKESFQKYNITLN